MDKVYREKNGGNIPGEKKNQEGLIEKDIL